MEPRLELLYDTETALRLVDGELLELTDGLSPSSASVVPFPRVLERVGVEVRAALSILRGDREGLEPPEITVAGGEVVATSPPDALGEMEARLIAAIELLEQVAPMHATAIARRASAAA